MKQQWPLNRLSGSNNKLSLKTRRSQQRKTIQTNEEVWWRLLRGQSLQNVPFGIEMPFSSPFAISPGLPSFPTHELQMHFKISLVFARPLWGNKRESYPERTEVAPIRPPICASDDISLWLNSIQNEIWRLLSATGKVLLARQEDWRRNIWVNSSIPHPPYKYES